MPLNLFFRSRAASGKRPAPGPAAKLHEPGIYQQEMGRISAGFSTLAGFESALRLIDHIDAALATHDAIVAMPGAQRFQ